MEILKPLNLYSFLCLQKIFNFFGVQETLGGFLQPPKKLTDNLGRLYNINIFHND